MSSKGSSKSIKGGKKHQSKGGKDKMANAERKTRSRNKANAALGKISKAKGDTTLILPPSRFKNLVKAMLGNPDLVDQIPYTTLEVAKDKNGKQIFTKTGKVKHVRIKHDSRTKSVSLSSDALARLQSICESQFLEGPLKNARALLSAERDSTNFGIQKKRRSGEKSGYVVRLSTAGRKTLTSEQMLVMSYQYFDEIPSGPIIVRNKLNRHLFASRASKQKKEDESDNEEETKEKKTKKSSTKKDDAEEETKEKKTKKSSGKKDDESDTETKDKEKKSNKSSEDADGDSEMATEKSTKKSTKGRKSS